MADKLVRYTRDNGHETRWIVVGPKGAVDFHCTRADHEIAQQWGRSGGVEFHHRAGEGEADHLHCWMLGGPCWHDGTSLWAMEHWIPLLEREGEAAIWAELERTYHAHDWPMPTEAEVSRA